MEGEPAILYSCITRGTLLLVEYTKNYEHNFAQVAQSMMQTLASHTDYKAVYNAHE